MRLNKNYNYVLGTDYNVIDGNIEKTNNFNTTYICGKTKNDKKNL